MLSDNNPGGGQGGGGGGGQPQHLVYLERLKKLRAAGGLTDAGGNIDQENVENYSKSQQQSSAYTSGNNNSNFIINLHLVLMHLFNC